MSKGSKRRKEDTQKVLENWDSIFGKKKVSITDLKNVIEIKNGTKQNTKS
jgi:hypothetical protein|tara:strand:+ start:222 stop:371 length:150 start_codon:yes stop_codon:yes gene_type:complete